MSRSSKVFLLVLLAALGGVLYALNTLGGPGQGLAEGETVSVTVPEGAGADEVAALLEEEGVISSAFAFRVTARLDDRAKRIHPGTYQLEAGMGAREILAVLSQQPASAPVFRVTIPEGLTVEQTLQRIADAESSPFTAEQLAVALLSVPLPDWAAPARELPDNPPYGDLTTYEGLLFPDTYEFLQDANPTDVLARLVRQTDAVLDEITPPAGMTRYDVLILASLIEREARVAEERPLVSAVMHNRLAESMRLQIDATVIYALGEIRNQVLTEELQTDSAWNTYVRDGLPPTPISGAGRASIQAAANPALSESLYYVVCDTTTGRHVFSSTLDEHNANVAQLRALPTEGGSFCPDAPSGEAVG